MPKLQIVCSEAEWIQLGELALKAGMKNTRGLPMRGLYARALLFTGKLGGVNELPSSEQEPKAMAHLLEKADLSAVAKALSDRFRANRALPAEEQKKDQAAMSTLATLLNLFAPGALRNAIILEAADLFQPASAETEEEIRDTRKEMEKWVGRRAATTGREKHA